MSCRERERASRRIDGLNSCETDSTAARGRVDRLVRCVTGREPLLHGQAMMYEH
jgi:hypothetical protein